MNPLHNGISPNTGDLPPLNLEQVRQKLVALLSDACDLSAYIEGFDDDGTIVVKNFFMDNQPSCATLPKPTLIGTGTSDERLKTAHGALLTANVDFSNGDALRIRLSKAQPACVDASGRVVR